MASGQRKSLLRNLLDGACQVRALLCGVFRFFTVLRARSLPGSVTERDVITSFSRMLPELLRFSSSHHLVEKIPEELQAIHRPTRGTKRPIAGEHKMPKKRAQLWDEWKDADAADVDVGDDDLDLDAFGL